MVFFRLESRPRVSKAPEIEPDPAGDREKSPENQGLRPGRPGASAGWGGYRYRIQPKPEIGFLTPSIRSPVWTNVKVLVRIQIRIWG